MRRSLVALGSLAAPGLLLGCQVILSEVDPTTSGGDDASSTGDVEPATRACETYLECAAVVIPEGVDPLYARFGAGGSCWTQGPPQASQCDDVCRQGLEQLGELAPDEPACDPAGIDTDEDPGPITERQIDMLFVVDNSGSMGLAQSVLARSADVLIERFDTAWPAIDYRIAVTTTDNGNPWCATASPPPAAGALVATSCRERLQDFVQQVPDVVDLAWVCTDECTYPTLALEDPWLDVTDSQGGSVARNVLRCMLPQGVRGCGYEQPLESAYKAIQRFDDPQSPSYGFHRPGALLGIVYVTDELDCSYNPAAELAFLPEGNRIFWSDPEAVAPTSALCWNAGVACTGGAPVYDDCVSADRNLDGEPASSPPNDAVLRPVDRYVDQLVAGDVFVAAINGVYATGQVEYTTAGTAEELEVFGIGPGCDSQAITAYPPVRIREVVEQISGNTSLHSICNSFYDGALNGIANELLARLPYDALPPPE